MKKILWLVLLVFLSVSVSCKKKSCPTETPTKTDMLTREDWEEIKAEKYDAGGNLVGTTPYHHEKMIFTRGGEYFYLLSDGSIYSYGTWIFENHQTELTLTGHNNVTNHYHLEKLDRHDLVLSIDVTQGGNPYKVLHYYTH